MSDWKSKIDAHLEEQRRKQESEERARAERERRQQDEEQRRNREREENERNRKVAKLGSRFKCHICGKPATKPSMTYKSVRSGGGDHVGGFWINVEDGENWNNPADLTKCDKCHRWVCFDCEYMGICKNCARNL